jgi:DNA-binding response OmpR family regulator
MPEMDGFAFLKVLRERADWREIPVVVLTSKDLTADEKRFLQGQAEDVFSKGDVDLRDLAAQIRVMVGQGADAGSSQPAQTGQSASEPTS